MENSWNDRVKNKVLHRVKEERTNLQTITGRKGNWISHTLCSNCLLNLIIQGKIGGYGRRGGGRKQLLDDLKEGRRYWKMYVAVSGNLLWKTLQKCRKREYAVLMNRIFPCVVLKTPDIIMQHCGCYARSSI